MNIQLSTAIYLAGWAQLCILVASAIVPFRLDWRNSLAALPLLLRQMFWIYGGYIVLSIVSLGTISITQSEALADGSGLARAFCAYAAVFWGVRLALQPILAVKPFLTAWWLRAGYHLLTALFVTITCVLGWAAFH